MNRYWITFWIIYAVTLVLYPPVILKTDASEDAPIIRIEPGFQSPILEYFFDTSVITIDPSDIDCIDTYLIDDISCADKEAVIKYRKELQEAERRRLQEKIKEAEREQDGYYYVPLDPSESELKRIQHQLLKEC